MLASGTPASVPERREPLPSGLDEDEQFERARELLSRMEAPQGEQEVAEQLGVSKLQARKWLHRLADEGVLEKMAKSRVRY